MISNFMLKHLTQFVLKIYRSDQLFTMYCIKKIEENKVIIQSQSENKLIENNNNNIKINNNRIKPRLISCHQDDYTYYHKFPQRN